MTRDDAMTRRRDDAMTRLRRRPKARVAAERVVEARPRDAGVGGCVQDVEARARELRLRVGQRRRRAAAVVEELARDAVGLRGAVELALARADREVGLAHALVRGDDLELDAV